MGQTHTAISAYAASNARLQARIDQLEKAVALRDAQIERLTRTVRQLRFTVMREIKDIKGSLGDMQDAFSPSDSPPASASDSDTPAAEGKPKPSRKVKRAALPFSPAAATR